jgi:hypothetical protein
MHPQGTCLVGPPLNCTQLLYDTQFSEWDGSSCTAWVGVGWPSYHVATSGDDYWEIQSWGGSVYQQYTVPAGTDSADVNAVIYLIKNSVGSERVSVTITNTSGTVLQNLGTYYASSSGTTVSIYRFFRNTSSTKISYVPATRARLPMTTNALLVVGPMRLV